MFKKNRDLLRCIEERKNQSFFKVVQSADLSSENMRALPHDFVRNLSDNALSGKMKIKAQWGSSWEIEISKNPRFYFMDKSGWDKFVKESGLAENEFLTFTHKGKLNFTVNIFNHNGIEILQPSPQSTVCFFASSSRIKTEQDVKKEEVLSADLSYLGSRLAESTGAARKHKRKLSFGNSQTPKTTKPVILRRGASSSSSIPEFNVVIRKSYLNYLTIPKSVAIHQMPNKDSKFVIHHPEDKHKSWEVEYVVKGRRKIFSGGWIRLAREYPLTVEDSCKFTFIKPDELLLQVSKP